MPGVSKSLTRAAAHEDDRLLLRTFDADQLGAIGGQTVAFESNRAGLSGRHLQDAVILPGLALEVFAGVNCGVVLDVGDISVEKGLGGTFITCPSRILGIS